MIKSGKKKKTEEKIQDNIIQEMLDNATRSITAPDPFNEEILFMVDDLPTFKLPIKLIPLFEEFVPGKVTEEMVKRRSIQITQFYYTVVEKLAWDYHKQHPRQSWLQKCAPYKNRITMMAYHLQKERRMLAQC